LNKHKCLFYFFTKTENRRAENVLSGGLVPVGGGEDVGRRCRRVNMYKYYVHIYSNRKMRLLKLFQEWGDEG
jgi:hypothetical protein